MARISKNTNVSGAVGNLVFVQNGKYQYVRSKPGKVKQSSATKKAASVFGWVSSQDKVFRRVVVEKFSLLGDRWYAARHRARMKKTVASRVSGSTAIGDLSFQQPEALVGFDFNEDLLWEKTTQFYPEFIFDDPGTLRCEIPGLYWGKEIKPLKKTKSALLKLESFAIDPNTENMEITPIDTLNLVIAEGKSQAATSWEFSTNLNNHWIVIIGILTFEKGDSNLSSLERTSTCYLWAKNRG